MKKHFSIRVLGKVQGVFFRASTKNKADDLNIKGFVQNEKGGSVYIEAEGEEEKLNRFIAWCNVGPPQARVDQCIVQQSDIKDFKNFEITHQTS